MENLETNIENQQPISKVQFIQIPFAVLADKDLTSSEKLLYGLIKSYAKQTNYCFATNQHLGNMLGFAKSTVSSLISGLQEKGYISVNNVYANNWSYQFQRRIFLTNKEQVINKADTSHKGMPVRDSGMGIHEPEPPSANTEPPYVDMEIAIRNEDTPIQDESSAIQIEAKGIHEKSTPIRETSNIIDNTNKELIIDNKNRDIDNTNSDFGNSSLPQDSSNEINSLSNQQFEGYYSNEDIERYFQKELFITYWRNASSGNPNVIPKEELLSMSMEKRMFSKSFEVFNRFAKILDEKELNYNTKKDQLVDELIENFPKSDWSTTDLRTLFSQTIDDYYQSYQCFPTSIEEKRFLELAMKHIETFHEK